MNNLISEKDLEPIHENCRKIQAKKALEQVNIKKVQRLENKIMASVIVFFIVLGLIGGILTHGF